MTTEQKHEIRKLAKKQFNIPKSAWINVLQLDDSHYEISYLVDRDTFTERKEVLVVN